MNLDVDFIFKKCNLKQKWNTDKCRCEYKR